MLPIDILNNIFTFHFTLSTRLISKFFNILTLTHLSKSKYISHLTNIKSSNPTHKQLLTTLSKTIKLPSIFIPILTKFQLITPLKLHIQQYQNKKSSYIKFKFLEALTISIKNNDLNLTKIIIRQISITQTHFISTEENLIQAIHTQNQKLITFIHTHFNLELHHYLINNHQIFIQASLENNLTFFNFILKFFPNICKTLIHTNNHLLLTNSIIHISPTLTKHLYYNYYQNKINNEEFIPLLQTLILKSLTNIKQLTFLTHLLTLHTNSNPCKIFLLTLHINTFLTEKYMPINFIKHYYTNHIKEQLFHDLQHHFKIPIESIIQIYFN